MAPLFYENKLGWDVPRGTYPCWIISDEERINSLKNNVPFHDYNPSCYFQEIKKLDNNFIEGYLGHSSNRGRFHENIDSSKGYLSDYQKRKPVYLSFDRITLYKLIEIRPTSPLTFMLKRIDSPKSIILDKAFMIMPFKYDNINAFYSNGIRDFLLKEMGIQIYRADDFNGNDIIIETIYNQIEESEFIIADISHPNKNVFYELGWASAMEKEIITIQNREIEENVFFDRAHIRSLFYSFNHVVEFQSQLKNTITAIKNKVLAKT